MENNMIRRLVAGLAVVVAGSTFAQAAAVTPPPSVRTIAVGGDRLSIGEYRLEKLTPADTGFARLGGQIVNALGSPDILALSGLDDSSGASDGGTVASNAKTQLLVNAVVAAGGPIYSVLQINSGNIADGGEAVGSRRVVQLYNPQRVSFVPGTNGFGRSLDATTPMLDGRKLALTLSPGHVSPADSAWNSNSKPLAVTYDFNGRRLVVLNLQFDSKRIDGTLRDSGMQRSQQSAAVSAFVASTQALDPAARIVVLGDFGDSDSSVPLKSLGAGVDGRLDTLRSLGSGLVTDQADRGGLAFTGDSQARDHILATPSLLSASTQYQVVRIDAESADPVAGHDAQLASFLLAANVPPVVRIEDGQERPIEAGDVVGFDARRSYDPDGFIVSYRWTQVSGPPVVLSPDSTSSGIGFYAPYTYTGVELGFTLTITDNGGASSSLAFTVNVRRLMVPPVVVDDTFTMNQGTTANIDALANDYDLNDDPIYISNVHAGRGFADGSASIQYTPYPGFYGTDYIDYCVFDGHGDEACSSGTVTVTVNHADFSFTSVADVEPHTLTVSEPITFNGLTAPTPISIVNGSYSVNGGGFTTASRTLSPGDTVKLQLLSSSSFNTTTTATANIGGVSARFSATTRQANTFPTPFSFAPVSNAPLAKLVVSNSIVVTGIEGPAAVSVVGGEFSINNGNFSNGLGAVVNNADTVRVRLLSSSQVQTTTSATLTINRVSAVFSVTTEATDATPNAFSFASRTGVPLHSAQTSETITIGGFNTPVTISVGGGSYSIDGGPFVNTPGTISPGASVALLQTSSRRFNTTTTTILIVGGVSGSYSVTTRKAFQRANGSKAEPDEDLPLGLTDHLPLFR